jgi:hypothetical protein
LLRKYTRFWAFVWGKWLSELALEHKCCGANQYDVVVIVMVALQGYLKHSAGGNDLNEVVLDLVASSFSLGLAGFSGVEYHAVSMNK